MPTPHAPPRSAVLRFALAAFLVLLAAPAAAQDEAPAAAETKAPPVTVTKIALDPAAPAVDQLVKLTVTLESSGEEILTAFGFDVTVNGVALPVYDKQLFVEPLAPGATLQLPLYNFWTTETSRPAPKDGELTVSVVLREARPMTRSTEEDGTEVWDLGEPLDALPAPAVEHTVPLGAAGG